MEGRVNNMAKEKKVLKKPFKGKNRRNPKNDGIMHRGFSPEMKKAHKLSKKKIRRKSKKA